MRITLNDIPEELPGDATTARDVLAAKGWSFPLIIMKVNGVLVPRDAWDGFVIRDGDAVEALHLVSGG